MPKVTPLDNMVRRMARNRADKVREAFAQNPKNRYSVLKQMEDDLIGELTPMLTRQWKPAARVDHMKDILESGRFKNQLESGHSGGAYAPDIRREFSNLYFYGNGPFGSPDHDFELEKYGYLRRPKSAYGEDDVDFYGRYDVTFKPSVRKHMTVTNGDSFNNMHQSKFGVVVGTPIVPDDPETYINWVANPTSLDDTDLATEDLFRYTLDDLRMYHRPTFRPGNEKYIEAQYHGPLTVKDIKSVRPKGNVPDWLREGAERYGFKIEE